MARAQLADSKRQLDAALQALAPPSPLADTDTGGRARAGATLGGAPPSSAGTRADTDSSQRPAAFSALTRVLVGATLLGLDELARRAPMWERQAAEALGPEAQEPPRPQRPPSPAMSAPTGGDIALRALTGWIFTVQDQLGDAPDLAGWLRAVGAHMAQTTRALANESLGGVLERPQPGMVGARDPTIKAWIARGHAEELHSRALARVALEDIMHSTMDVLASEPAVQELIQSHSTSLAGEVLEEVRERAVSADLAVARLTRRLFGARAGGTAVGSLPMEQLDAQEVRR